MDDETDDVTADWRMLCPACGSQNTSLSHIDDDDELDLDLEWTCEDCDYVWFE